MGAVDILKISFEFSPKQGIRELPDLNSKYESNVRGMFVVGDMADELTAGLVFRSQRWPSLTVHNSTRKPLRDTTASEATAEPTKCHWDF